MDDEDDISSGVNRECAPNPSATNFGRPCFPLTDHSSSIPQIAAEPPGERDAGADADMQAKERELFSRQAELRELSSRMAEFGVGCSKLNPSVAKEDLKLKTKEETVQNLEKANVRGETDVADLSGLKCRPLIEDSPNTSGGISLEAHVESQSDNSEEPLDWKKVVLDSIAAASMVLVTDRYLEEDLVLKILDSCSEEISTLIQSEASLSMNKVVSGVSSTIIKNFVVCIRLLEKRMSRMQNINNRQSLEISRLNAEIEAAGKH